MVNRILQFISDVTNMYIGVNQIVFAINFYTCVIRFKNEYLQVIRASKICRKDGNTIATVTLELEEK